MGADLVGGEQYVPIVGANETSVLMRQVAAFQFTDPV